jgi:hypothetical protein
MSLKAMSVSKLKALKSQVEATIHAKVIERRHEIESELLELSRFDVNGRAKVVRAEARGVVALKHRKPRPTPKAAKKLDEPLADSPRASTPKRPKKTRKASKTRKVANRVAAVLSTLPAADHIQALPIEAVAIEPPPVEALPVASIQDNVTPADVSVAA